MHIWYLSVLLLLFHNVLKQLSTFNFQLFANGLLLEPPSFRARATLSDTSFQGAAPKLWNALPHVIRSISNINAFKRHLKTHLFSNVLCTFTSANFHRRHAFSNNLNRPSKYFRSLVIGLNPSCHWIPSSFQNCACFEKHLKDNKHNSLWFLKYARIVVLGHYHLFLKTQSYSNSLNVGKLFASRNRLCPIAYIRVYNQSNVFACDRLV